MNLNGVDLNLLLLFEAILAEGSLTRAAERLDMSQPTVSNALNRLRNALDDPLFVRAGSGMQPTPKAQQLAEPVMVSLATLRESFQASLSFDPAKHHQHFRIGMSDYTASVMLPMLMQTLRSQAPGITLSVLPLSLNTAHDALKTGKLDLLVTSEFSGAGLYQQRLYHEDFVCLLRKQGAQPKKLSLEAYLNRDHILYSLEGAGPGIVDKQLAQQGRKRKIALRVAYISMIPELIATTDLVVTLPRRTAEQFASHPKLTCYAPPIDIPGYTVKQFWHEKFHKDPGSQWLRELIHHLCAS